MRNYYFNRSVKSLLVVLASMVTILCQSQGGFTIYPVISSLTQRKICQTQVINL